MLKKLLIGVSATLLVASLAYAQNAPQGGAAPAAGARGGRGAGAGAGGAAGGAAAGAPARARTLPTAEEWANFPKTKQYVARAMAEAGDDPDLLFDVGIFCKASGGSGNEDRATIGVPAGAPYPPFPGPQPAIHMPAQHMF